MVMKLTPEIQIENFRRLLQKGRDDALLRYSLGSAYFKIGELDAATVHLEAAIRHNSNYSAAYKVLANVHQQSDKLEAAIEAYENGIIAAGRAGDKQAQKEMQVFLKRLKKNQ